MNQAELNEALIEASIAGDVEKVRELLQARSTCGFTYCADVHAGDDYALRYSAENGHTATVQVLLQAGANIHALDDCALRWAADGGHVETVQVLLQAGANVHARDDDALRSAAYYGRTAILQVLLQACADVHAMNDHALCWAVYGGRTATVQVLLQAGADCSKVNLSRLKKFLTPEFLLSLSDDVLLRMENDQQELKKYHYGEKITLLKEIKKEDAFGIKINLADLYYRPGEPGYYRAISC